MPHRYYHICSSNIGRVALIRTYDGRVYTGRISRVTGSHVCLTPVGEGISDKDKKELKRLAEHAVSSKKDEKGSEVQFFFPFVIPFAAIAALTFAAAATPFFGFRRPFVRRRRFFY